MKLNRAEDSAKTQKAGASTLGASLDTMLEDVQSLSNTGQNPIAAAYGVLSHIVEIKETIQGMLSRFDVNKDGKLDKKELYVMFANKEFWGTLALFFLPVLASLIEAFQVFLMGGEFGWQGSLVIVVAIYLPLVIAWIRRNLIIATRYLEYKYNTLAEVVKQGKSKFDTEIKQFVITLNMQAQYIKLNIGNDKQPADATFKDSILTATDQRSYSDDILQGIKLSNKQIDDYLQSIEFSTLVVLFLLPIFSSVFQMVIMFMLVKVWYLQFFYQSLAYILLPVLVPILRKRFDRTASEIRDRITALESEYDAMIKQYLLDRDQLMTAINLQGQFIKLFGDPSKAPLFLSDVSMEELRSQNATLLIEKMRLETELKAHRQYIKQLDPNYKTGIMAFAKEVKPTS